MDKNSIITEIYLSKEIKAFKDNLPEAIREDVIQHVFCEILEKTEEFIMDLHTRGKIKPYIVVCIYNAAKLSKFNSFGRLQSKESYPDILPDVFEEYIETPDIEQLYWYDKGLMKLYADYQTFKAVSEDTNIPETSVRRSIIKAREKIKRYNNYINTTTFR